MQLLKSSESHRTNGLSSNASNVMYVKHFESFPSIALPVLVSRMFILSECKRPILIEFQIDNFWGCGDAGPYRVATKLRPTNGCRLIKKWSSLYACDPGGRES